MNIRNQPWGAFSLLPGWVFANLLGWITGLVAAQILAPLGARSPFPWHYDTDKAIAYASLVLLGITVGISQWLVYRSYLPNAKYWIPATMIGYLLSVIIFALANNDPARLIRTELLNNMILLGLMGFVIGVSQWWVLRQHFERSGLWVLASTFGFLFFIWLIVDPTHSQIELIIRAGLVWAFAAAVSGATLIWIIRQSDRPEIELAG
jgi:hypothetical protein